MFVQFFVLSQANSPGLHACKALHPAIYNLACERCTRTASSARDFGSAASKISNDLLNSIRYERLTLVFLGHIGYLLQYLGHIRLPPM